MQAAEAAGRPVGWVRGLLPRVRMVARHAGPPPSLVAAVGVLEGGPVRTVQEASAALFEAGVCAGPVHPGGVLRAAEVLGPATFVQLLTASGSAGPGAPDEAPAVVAPAGRALLERSVMSAVVAADRRGDVVDLAEVAAGAGVPVVAVRAVLEPQRGWQTHEGAGGAWWAWRQPLVRKRGLVTSVVVRLLAVRGYDVEELHAAVVDVVDRLSPAIRRDASVPPAGVLAAWLDAQGLLLAPAAGGAASGGGLRCSSDLAVASDTVLLEAVTAAGGSAEAADLAGALRAAGYTASTAAQLARTSPVLVRVGRGRYAPR
ncbi:hypothetical protein [uncultured Pseudokineococcus sp.]|uniref:hypothetical protein n=1 Tax=uncultured Pseudokineococcus sp. TaxID=1642928 RepID=UPI002610F948|nr:hypothetical protein [uncultured Pseudokineococcus sp.]